MKNKVSAAMMAAVMVLGMTACGSSEAAELTVFAAASMTETLTEIAEMYKTVAPNISLVFNFDSSGTL